MATLIESFISKSARTMYDALWFPYDSRRGEVFLYERTWSEDRQLYNIKRGPKRQKVESLEEAFHLLRTWKVEEGLGSRAPSIPWERRVKVPGQWTAVWLGVTALVVRGLGGARVELTKGSQPVAEFTLHHVLDAPELLLMVERLLLPLTHERWYNAK